MEDNAPQTHDEPQDVSNDDQQQDVQEQTQETTEQVTESTETESTPAQVVEEVEEPEADEDEGAYNPLTDVYQAPQLQVPQIDLSQIPVDEEGNADVNELAKVIQSQVAAATQAAVQQSTALVNELEEKRREELLWQKATDKYPELKDKQYAKEVQAYRFGMFANEVSSGNENVRMMSPAQAAAAFNKRFSAAKADGVKQVTENVRVQESAYIEPTSGASSNAKSSNDQLISAMRSPDRSQAEAASNAYLKKLLFGD